ncbi:uncharacterized protein A4U43_C05F16870 [Asparagus officinalis]|uniref:Uncharacterized protein n=1 Tax=Asparagus officinalis TaxID=4686 RepID=A0A5P1EUN5_ASPOF|nr:uncharacterized protein A4U43_C05F16870 [Asparagus officinalis]
MDKEFTILTIFVSISVDAERKRKEKKTNQLNTWKMMRGGTSNVLADGIEQQPVRGWFPRVHIAHCLCEETMPSLPSPECVDPIMDHEPHREVTVPVHVSLS